MTLHALSISHPRFSVHSIDLHLTHSDAVTALWNYLQTGHEDEDDYSDKSIDGMDDERLYQHCRDLADRQECEWTIEECRVPTDGPADRLGPLNTWADTLAQTSQADRTAINDDAAAKVQHYARIAGYFSVNSPIHDRAVYVSNALVRKVRKALGFSYPTAGDISF